VAVGNFEISSDEVTEEIRKTLINANATAIMFPYIRAFIATFTANLGHTTGAIDIPTKFFKGNIKEFSPTAEEILLNKPEQQSVE
jgi:preprotein translocase subunit SecB